jgi:hypothetical protein
MPRHCEKDQQKTGERETHRNNGQSQSGRKWGDVLPYEKVTHVTF